MKESPNIDELLNCFIDGELTERHRTEIQRLISHDAQVAGRLRELQKCKALVSSLPRAEAPADMVERVEASLERMSLLGRESSGFDERKGARHLLVRKVLAAAAMIGLVAVLTTLVYTIVVPENVPPPVAFEGRLELKTGNLVAVDAVITRAIENSDILRQRSPRGRPGKKVYALTCSPEALGLLLADLEKVWKGFDSATLYVETKTRGEPVVVSDVSTEQIVDLVTPPKPRLTGPVKPTEEPPGQVEEGRKVRLTIVVAGSE
ncbi:MAG: anti-sigma factor family protein [Planctomycetota bacterium]|jgi:hypothetical protein